LIQRVSEARVDVAGKTVGEIGRGLLALVAVEPDDGEAQVERTLMRLLGYRVFEDEDGKMNRSLHDIAGGLLLVSQFTLAADTRKGMRPSFTSAAPPEAGLRWYNRLVERARAAHSRRDRPVRCEHAVHLVNDGPVTFWLQTFRFTGFPERSMNLDGWCASTDAFTGGGDIFEHSPGWRSASPRTGRSPTSGRCMPRCVRRSPVPVPTCRWP
jgi:D-tyrosyl-tRNA(Tyr) deacylase